MTIPSSSPAWTPEKEAELVAAIVYAVPEILDANEGCRVRYWNLDGHSQHTIITSKEGHERHLSHPKIDGCDVLGRPITLEDVLRALRVVATVTAPYFDIAAPLLGAWDMGKPLSDQSEPTKQFLHQLLCRDSN